MTQDDVLKKKNCSKYISEDNVYVVIIGRNTSFLVITHITDKSSNEIIITLFGLNFASFQGLPSLFSTNRVISRKIERYSFLLPFVQ